MPALPFGANLFLLEEKKTVSFLFFIYLFFYSQLPNCSYVIIFTITRNINIKNTMQPTAKAKKELYYQPHILMKRNEKGSPGRLFSIMTPFIPFPVSTPIYNVTLQFLPARSGGYFSTPWIWAGLWDALTNIIQQLWLRHSESRPQGASYTPLPEPTAVSMAYQTSLLQDEISYWP